MVEDKRYRVDMEKELVIVQEDLKGSRLKIVNKDELNRRLGYSSDIADMMAMRSRLDIGRRVVRERSKVL